MKPRVFARGLCQFRLSDQVRVLVRAAGRRPKYQYAKYRFIGPNVYGTQAGLSTGRFGTS